MNKKLIITFLFFWQTANAQKQISSSAQAWIGYIQNLRFSKHWGATADVHFRTAEKWVKGRNLSLLRLGAVYFIKDAVQASAGYAYFHYYPAGAHAGVSRPEHRGWQQLQWFNNGPKLRMMNRVRLEERWRRKIASANERGEGYNFNYRTRFAAQLLYPLGKKPFAPGSLALMLMDDVMLNFGKEIIYNTFDQNRAVAGVQWHVSKASFLQAGYMHIFQQQAVAGQYRQTHTARIFYTCNLDLRHNK